MEKREEEERDYTPIIIREERREERN